LEALEQRAWLGGIAAGKAKQAAILESCAYARKTTAYFWRPGSFGDLSRMQEEIASERLKITCQPCRYADCWLSP
jgi:hypothetical protein